MTCFWSSVGTQHVQEVLKKKKKEKRKKKGEWIGKVEISSRKKSLAVKLYSDTLHALKAKPSSSDFLTDGGLNFCVRSTPLRGEKVGKRLSLHSADSTSHLTWWKAYLTALVQLVRSASSVTVTTQRSGHSRGLWFAAPQWRGGPDQTACIRFNDCEYES